MTILELNQQIGAAVQRASAELPEGFEIQIGLEHGAGWVTLYDDDGESTDDFDGDTLAYMINAAIDHAKRKAANDDSNDPPICCACNGSGEGQHEGTRCYKCRGSGVERMAA